MGNWQVKLLEMRSKNNKAIAAAHVDAGSYGAGWLKVDHHGNLVRVNPSNVIITEIKVKK